MEYGSSLRKSRPGRAGIRKVLFIPRARGGGSRDRSRAELHSPRIDADSCGPTRQMLLLLTDTSGKKGSVALARVDESAGSENPQVIGSVPLAGGTFSAQLVPQIADLLNQHHFKKSDIGAFVVVSGPGSFTGLRVGLAAIKALAEILNKPIVSVSLLEVVAVAGGGQGNVVAALDAGRGEVYVGQYELIKGGSRLVEEKLLTSNEFLKPHGSTVVVTPDETLAAVARN